MKDGKCDLEHPGVKAPGTPKIATFLPANKSFKSSSTGPPSAPVTSSVTFTLGKVSPTFTSAADMAVVDDEEEEERKEAAVVVVSADGGIKAAVASKPRDETTLVVDKTFQVTLAMNKGTEVRIPFFDWVDCNNHQNLRATWL